MLIWGYLQIRTGGKKIGSIYFVYTKWSAHPILSVVMLQGLKIRMITG